MSGVGAAAALAWRRTLAAPGRWLPAALAVAVGIAFVIALAGAGVVAGDHAARRTLAAVPSAQRAVVLNWVGGAGAKIDSGARDAARAMGGGPVTRSLLMVPARFGRNVVRLSAIAPLAPWVQLRTGRLPRGTCRAARCEVVALDRPAPPVIAEAGIRLVVVGRARLRSAVPLGFTTLRQPGGQQQPLLLAAGDPVGLDALPRVASISRTQAWRAGLALAPLHAWQLGAALDRFVAGRTALDKTPGLSSSTPERAVARARERARRTPGRLNAAAATGLAALLAFLVVTALSMREGLLAEDRRLRHAGASVVQRATMIAVECAVPVLAGLVAGVALGVGVVLARAEAGAVSAGQVLPDALSTGVAPVGWAVATAFALLVLATCLPALGASRLAAAGVIAAAAGLAGMLAPRSVGTTDPLPAAVIPIAGVALGLALGLALPAGLRALARVGPARAPLARVAVLQLAREPGPVAVAAAGLAVAVGLAGFAASYRATLDRSRGDQAAHRVPLAATVLPGPSLRSPLRSAPPATWERLGATVAPVVRRDAFALEGPTRSPVSLLGVPAPVMAKLSAWRSADAPSGRAALARRLVTSESGQQGPPAPAVRLPAEDVPLRLRVAVEGPSTEVVAIVRRPGDEVLDRVALGRAGPRTRVLAAHVPAVDRGGLLYAVAFAATESAQAIAGHQGAEGGTDTALGTGKARLGALSAGGTVLTRFAGWTGHGGATGAPALVRFVLGAEPAIVRPPAKFDHTRLPVIADAETAADAQPSGRFELDVLGVHVPARVVGTLRRFPTLRSGSPIVIADQRSLSDAIDARVPGAGEPGELWLARREAGKDPGPAAASAGRRLGLRVRTHAAVAREIDSEPVSREVLGALSAAALLAAALAVAGVAAAIGRALRDGARPLSDLEAQGVGPARLRRVLRYQAAITTAAALVPGIALGVALDRLVVAAVRTGALSTPPDPPLVSVVPWGATAAGAAVILACIAAVAGALTTRGLREP